MDDLGRRLRENTLPEAKPYEKGESHEEHRNRLHTESFGFRVLCDELRAFLYDLGSLH